MWCKNCNKSYDTDGDTCEKCGAKLEEYTPIIESDNDDVVFLTNDLPDEPREECETLENKNNLSEMLFDGEPKLLITVIGDDEAQRIIELLEQNKIPSMKKDAEPHTADESCDNDFEGSERELLDLEEADEDYEAEFSALCDEALDGERLYDIFVPAECLSNALRIVIEDEQMLDEQDGNSDGRGEGQEHCDFGEQDDPCCDCEEKDCSEQNEEELCNSPSKEKDENDKKGLFGFLHRKRK